MEELNQAFKRLGLVEKSDELSKKFKLAGNEVYVNTECCYGSLFLYNKAICCAESKENLAIAYANRSAMFLDLGLYDDCLLNIRWARMNGYPEEKIQKLNEREKKAKILKAVLVKDPIDDPWNFIKLSHPANPKIPFIVDCLEMKKTEKFGRGIYATRDISTGDILSIEDPVISYPNAGENCNYYRCFNCIKTCRMNLIPCLKTNCYMFCSEDCRDKTYKKMPGEELFEGSHRKICADIEEKFGGRKKLIKFLKKVPNITKLDYSVFDFDWSDPNDPHYGINQAKCIMSLIGVDYHRFAFIPNAAPFELQDTIAKGNKLIAELATHLLNVMSPGMMRIKRQNPIAAVMFVNLINYSCISNVQYIQVDNKTVLYATQPIKAGEQLFESVKIRGPCGEVSEFHYVTMPTEIRQGASRKMFDFTCDCRACQEDLNPEKIQNVDKAFNERSVNATKACFASTKAGSLKPAIEQWKLNNDFITEHHENLLAKDVHMIKHHNLVLLESIALRN